MKRTQTKSNQRSTTPTTFAYPQKSIIDTRLDSYSYILKGTPCKFNETKVLEPELHPEIKTVRTAYTSTLKNRRNLLGPPASKLSPTASEIEPNVAGTKENLTGKWMKSRGHETAGNEDISDFLGSKSKEGELNRTKVMKISRRARLTP